MLAAILSRTLVFKGAVGLRSDAVLSAVELAHQYRAGYDLDFDSALGLDPRLRFADPGHLGLDDQLGAKGFFLDLVGDAAFDISPVVMRGAAREILVPNCP